MDCRGKNVRIRYALLLSRVGRGKTVRRVSTRDKRGEGVRLLCEWNAKINTPGDGGHDERQ